MMHRSISRVRTTDDVRAADVLEQLPAGFAVFHDVPLPKPSRATIDHVVAAPFGLWAISVESPGHEVTFGQGRGADTLWAGRTPLRIPIEECESNAAALSAALGRPAQALLCLEGELPSESFDFHGLAVCSPAALAEQLSVAIADFESVDTVVRRIEELLGSEPAAPFELPRLGAAVGVGPSTGSTPRRRIRTRVPRRGRRSRVGGSRMLLVLGAVALAVFLEPAWFGLGDDPSAMTEPTLERTTGPTTADPSPITYGAACGLAGETVLTWSWPGRLPDGVTSYGIRTRHRDGTVVDHTVGGWRVQGAVPMPVEIDDDVLAVITEHRNAAGEVIASVERPVVRPGPLDC
ncbi:MAG: NERD domain-containing protein [Ilumatobacter sp.]|nr:NERD domain-containing protein [Ilumatobacter sp.]